MAFVRVTRRLPSSYFRISREGASLKYPARLAKVFEHPESVKEMERGTSDTVHPAHRAGINRSKSIFFITGKVGRVNQIDRACSIQAGNALKNRYLIN